MTVKYSENAATIDVAYVAHLARLKLTEEETLRFQDQLDQVLNYAEDLKQLDVEGVEPTAHAVEVTNVFREDKPGQSLPHEIVLENAPAQTEEQFLVPRILE